jgi:bacteriorhodopsin
VTEQIVAILIGWLITAAILVIQHLLWASTSAQVRYLLGTGAICVGCSLTGAILENPLLIIAPWAIASSGLVVLAIHWFEAEQVTKQRQARKTGELVGAARGLLKELQDGQSSMEQNRSRN